ncbi:MAG: hypothetical protein ABS27_09400, partial [OM182 bacterium BACL3 MAG-121001-bin29]
MANQVLSMNIYLILNVSVGVIMLVPLRLRSEPKLSCTRIILLGDQGITIMARSRRCAMITTVLTLQILN